MRRRLAWVAGAATRTNVGMKGKMMKRFGMVAMLSLSVAGLGLAPVSLREARAADKAERDREHIEEIALSVGETKTIPAGAVKNYSVGADGVASVRLSTDNSQFVVAGSKEGSTTLLLIKNDGSQITWVISVTKFPVSKVERELSSLLEGLPGIRTKRVGGRIFIEGGVTNPEDAKRIDKIATGYGGMVENLVVQGSPGSDRRILVRVDFFFVKYNRNTGFDVGIGFPASFFSDPKNSVASFNWDLLARTNTPAVASITNHPIPRLDITQRHGWSKIFKQSTMITANGTQTSFNTGVEANFLATNSLATQALVKVNSGFLVHVTPRFDPTTKDIELKVDSEVADFLPPYAGTPVPSKDLSKIESIVSLKLGQALIISGFQTRSQRHSVQGLPFLSSIPVLGVLFGSHRDDVEESEGAVFLVPSVVETVPKSAIDVIKNAISNYEDYSGSGVDVNTYNKVPPAAK